MDYPTWAAQTALDKSFRELEKLTGIDPAQWSRWFNGVQSPSLATMERIAESLELDFLDCVAAFLDRRARTLAEKTESQ